MYSLRKDKQSSPYNYSKRFYETTQADRIIEESVRLSRAEEDIARESILRRSRMERQMAALEAERIRAEVQAELQVEELLRRQKEQAELEQQILLRLKRQQLLSQSQNKLQGFKAMAEREQQLLSESRRIEKELFQSRNTNSDSTRRRKVEQRVQSLLRDF